MQIDDIVFERPRDLDHPRGWRRNPASGLYIKGQVKVYVSDEPDAQLGPDGLLVGARLAYDDHNLFTNLGYSKIAALLAANTNSPAIKTPQYIGIGVETAIPGGGTAYGHEISRIAITSASVLSTYTARLSAVVGPTSLNYPALGSISLWDSAAGPGGTATGGSATTLQDSGAPFGAVSSQVNSYVNVITSAGASRFGPVLISANSSTQLTFASQSSSVTAGDIYLISPASSILWAYAAVAAGPKVAGQSAQILWLLTLPST